MKSRVRLPLVTLLLAILSLSVSAETMLYWSNWKDDTINRCNLDGTGMEIICDHFDGRGIAINSNTNSLYSSNSLLKDGSYHEVINRSWLDGSEEACLIMTEPRMLHDIEVDTVNNKLYWTILSTSSDSRIMKSNLDGTDIQMVISQANQRIHDLELDLENNHLYWTTWTDGKIWRSNLDGSGITELFTNTSLSNAEINHIALDLANGYIYFTTSHSYSGYYYKSGEVLRIDLNGSNLVKIIPESVLDIREAIVKGIVINPEEERLYFGVNRVISSSSRPAWIFSCNMDGSDLKEVISGMYGEPWELVFGPGPECVNRPVSDLDGDCKVTLLDLNIFVSEWLACGLEPVYECE